jgi:hypothetical protein
VPDTVLYLAGLGRSGSTLLERMIGELDGVSPAGELVHLWHRGVELNEACGCGEPFSECPFWTEVGQQAFGGWDKLPVQRVETLRKELDRSRRIPAMLAPQIRPGFAAKLREYTGYYATLYRAIQAVSGSSVVIDSSKHPSLAFALAARRDLDLRLVRMVRDPRAVAYSWTKANRRPGAGEGRMAAMTTYPPVRSAALWLGHNASLSYLQRMNVPLLTVRHEDVVSDPRAVIEQIAVWAGLGAAVALPVSATGVAHLTASHTVSGNPMRFQVGDVPIVADERWRTESSRRDRAVVTAVTIPLLRHFDYPLRPTSARAS